MCRTKSWGSQCPAAAATEDRRPSGWKQCAFILRGSGNPARPPSKDPVVTPDLPTPWSMEGPISDPVAASAGPSVM